MAQIRKFNTGAVIQPNNEVKPAYGKIYKNGIAYDVNEDTLGWLSSKGSVGLEMANELRGGTNQYIDVGSDGVGIIHGISREALGHLRAGQRRRVSRRQ